MHFILLLLLTDGFLAVAILNAPVVAPSYFVIKLKG